MNVPVPVWDWPRWYSKETPATVVRSCSFVSVLIPRWAIAAHGLPIKDYFIWHDDVEYTLRISQTNPGIFCPNSIVVHDTPENKGANFGLVTETSLWKFKYGVRNEVSRRRRDMGWVGVAAFVYHVRSQMKLHAVAARYRRALYRSVWEGLWFRPSVHNVDGSPR
jgi:GT2 family glycosyltransferase